MPAGPSTSKGKGKDGLVTMTEEDREAAEKQKRSFERSLAGPSVGKAGLMRDQTGRISVLRRSSELIQFLSEVNTIIAEASKGSKFYNNQVRKDEELTRKIAWFQAKRDELMKMAQAERMEAEAEKILVEVEASRDLTQSIVHVDMDAFYASVEVQREPSLKGKAFGVGQGVLTTASYEARKFGCRSGMAGFIAKKLCPHIILVPLNFDLYIEASKLVREILLQYDENTMMASLDEGYLNVTSYMSQHNLTAPAVVAQLRAEVEAKTKLTMSAGIAPNRMLAKICSDKNKPNGQFELEFDRSMITRFMRDMPVRNIPGFGRVTERCLEGLGVETCGDIFTRRAELLVMDHWFGFRGLCKAYLGIAENKVAPEKREERKSVGVERTFRDKTQDQDIMETLADIAEELGKDLEKLQYAGKTVTVKFKAHTFENKTRAQSVKKYVSATEEILPVNFRPHGYSSSSPKIAQELLRRELPLRIRLLGIRLSTLKDLTLPDTGIRNFFASPTKRKSKSNDQPDRSPSATSSDPEVIDLAQLEEEEQVEEEMGEGDFMPPEGIGDPEAKPSSTLRKRKDSCEAPATKSHLLGPICPICAQALGPSTSNQGLNDHIDWCLNKDAISTASKRIPKAKVSAGEDTAKRKGSGNDTAKKKGESKGSMMCWLKKEM